MNKNIQSTHQNRINHSKTHKIRHVHFPYQIAIPSYKNANLLRDTTLLLLKTYMIPSSKITLFVSNIDDYNNYKNIIPPNLYGAIILLGEYSSIYNSISHYYPIGTCIVYCDDSIIGIIDYKKSNNEFVESPLRSLLYLIQQGFNECCKHSSSFWGIYPIPTGHMKMTISTNLQYCCGSLWGCINPGIEELKLTQSTNDKEDYERSILYYLKDKKVIRMNNFCCLLSTKKVIYRPSTDLDGIYKLKKLYPTFITIIPHKNKSMVHISLKDRSNDVSGNTTLV